MTQLKVEREQEFALATADLSSTTRTGLAEVLAQALEQLAPHSEVRVPQLTQAPQRKLDRHAPTEKRVGNDRYGQSPRTRHHETPHETAT